MVDLLLLGTYEKVKVMAYNNSNNDDGDGDKVRPYWLSIQGTYTTEITKNAGREDSCAVQPEKCQGSLSPFSPPSLPLSFPRSL